MTLEAAQVDAPLTPVMGIRILFVEESARATAFSFHEDFEAHGNVGAHDAQPQIETSFLRHREPVAQPRRRTGVDRWAQGLVPRFGGNTVGFGIGALRWHEAHGNDVELRCPDGGDHDRDARERGIAFEVLRTLDGERISMLRAVTQRGCADLVPKSEAVTFEEGRRPRS